ncbi:MAG: hypothetical protein ACOY3F_07485 [Bacillota bacterium]
MDGAVVFPDAYSAKAAFALGPVKYRCLVCNRVHTSGSGEAERCRLNLSVQPGWGQTRSAGPYPPTMHFTPAFLFAAAVWDAWWPGPPSGNFEVPEWVLALDAFAPNLGVAFEEAVHEERERQRRCRAMAWENHRVFCRWMGALRRHRPPARIARLELMTPYPKRSGYYVTPAVLPPGWGEPYMKVPAERLWYNIWAWVPGNSLLGWGADTPLVLVSYSEYEFAAVFEVPVGWLRGYLVCRERYGEAPVARLAYDASTPEDALGRLGELQGIPAERSPV